MELDGIGTSNPGGTNNVRLQTLKTFDKHNLTIGAFLSGNHYQYPLVFGIFSKFHCKGYTISTQCSRTLHNYLNGLFAVEKIMYKSDKHAVDIDGMLARAKEPYSKSPFYGFNLGINYNHSRGHGIRVSTSYIPDVNCVTVNTSFKLNIWTSSNKATALDFTLNISQHLTGIFRGLNSYGGGLGFTHHF